MEDLMLELIDFFEDREVPELQQLTVVLGFATHLATKSDDPVLMAECASEMFRKMLNEFCK